MTHHFNRSLTMLATALEMEEKGKSFYSKAIGECHNDLGLKIFSMLKQDEDIHIQRIKSIYEHLQGTHTWDESWKTMGLEHKDLTVVFRELAATHQKTIKADTGDLAALDVGLDFEFRSVRFYEEQLKAAEDPLEIEFVKHMIEEERSHHSALLEMKAFLSDPAAWFRGVERGAFDGGTAMG